MSWHNSKGRKVYRVVLTGGPSGGKTSSISRIVSTFTELGFTVFVVNETATELMTNGIQINDDISPFEFQSAIVAEQRFKEDLYARIADNCETDVLILCDRGLLDGRAYTDPVEFDRILRLNALDEDDVLERYDAIIHLVTSALGKFGHYSQKENNDIRVECTPEEAVRSDRKTMKAWEGAKRLYIVGNETDFTGKLERVLNIIETVVGLEETPLGRERKYLVLKPDAVPLEGVRCSDIEQIYLDGCNDDYERRIRKTVHAGIPRYSLCERRRVPWSADRITSEEIISAHDYAKQSAQRQEGTCIVEKKRYSFIYDERHFSLDFFEGEDDYALVEVIAFDTEIGHIGFPDWLSVVADVTDDPDYSNYEISRRDALIA